MIWEWKTNHMTSGKTWRTFSFTKATVINSMRCFLQDMVDNSWNNNRIGASIPCILPFLGRMNGRRQMAALQCQEKDGHTLFCEQQTREWLTNNVCQREIQLTHYYLISKDRELVGKGMRLCTAMENHDPSRHKSVLRSRAIEKGWQQYHKYTGEIFSQYFFFQMDL